MSIYDKPVSQHGKDERTIAWGMDEDAARHVAMLLTVTSCACGDATKGSVHYSSEHGEWPY